MPVCSRGAWVIKPSPVCFIYATRQNERFIVIARRLLISGECGKLTWKTSAGVQRLLVGMSRFAAAEVPVGRDGEVTRLSVLKAIAVWNSLMMTL